MAAMTLTDGAVAALARQAADLVAPGLRVQVSPAADDDPYRWDGAGPGWTVRIYANSTVEVWVPRQSSPVSALHYLIGRLDEVAEGSARPGAAITQCPGHTHTPRVEVDGDDVVLRCPDNGQIVQRIAPVVEP
jgi:hypothetical protein